VKVRFVFHKGKDSFVGRAIVIWTGFLALFYNWRILRYSYSHEEMWIPDEHGNFGYIDFADTVNAYATQQYAGQCFSSTTRGKWKGVRFAPASEVLGKHPERYCYIECEVSDYRFEVFMDEAQRLVGAGYDYGFVLSFLQPFLVQNPDDWACSEISDWAKVLLRLKAKRSKRISPRRSAYLLSKVWGQPKPLKGE